MLFAKPGLSFTKIAVGFGLCFSSTVAIAQSAPASCQGQPGCVLPVGTAPPVVSEPVTTAPPVYVEDDAKSFSLLPLLLGLLAAGALLYFLVLDDDDDEEPISP